MARSEGLLVAVMLPWLKSAAMAATCAPRPICLGFVPPSVALGAEPKLSVFASWVAKATFDSLKPVVPALEILLPRTLISVSFRDSPFSDVLRADVSPIVAPRSVAKRRCDFLSALIGQRQIKSVVFVATGVFGKLCRLSLHGRTDFSGARASKKAALDPGIRTGQRIATNELPILRHPNHW